MQQPPIAENTKLFSSSTKERIIITASVVNLIICLIAFMDLCYAALCHKHRSLLNIKVSQTSTTVIVCCFLVAYSCILWAIKKRSRKFWQALKHKSTPLHNTKKTKK